MGFIKRNGQRKEETDPAEKKEYSFPENAELKACRYCQTMIPKTARICPNCRKRLKKNWLGIFLGICLLAACAAGVYYYVVVYSVTRPVSGNGEVVQSEEAVQDAEAERKPEEGIAAGKEQTAGSEAVEENEAGTDGTGTDAAVQIENLPEIPAALGVLVDSETEKNDGLTANIEKEEEAEKKAEAGKDGEPEKGSEPEKDGESEKEAESEKSVASGKEAESGENGEAEEEAESEEKRESGNGSEAEKEKAGKDGAMTEKGTESGEAAEEKDRAGMMADDETDTESESDENLADGTVKITDTGEYTEEEFRDICKQVDYKKLLRGQERYLNAAVTEELTVMEQVDGGLFDENLYYLCKREDEQGITRYYIIRDDREEGAEPILEGDVLRVYGQLFGSCKLPGYLNRTQPVVPALTMIYYDLLEE